MLWFIIAFNSYSIKWYDSTVSSKQWLKIYWYTMVKAICRNQLKGLFPSMKDYKMFIQNEEIFFKSL